MKSWALLNSCSVKVKLINLICRKLRFRLPYTETLFSDQKIFSFKEVEGNTQYPKQIRKSK